MAKSSTTVATREKVPPKNDVAVSAELEHAALFAEYAGAGMETVGAADVSIPRFKLLQDLSPEVNKRKAEYIEGAEPGQILNTATKAVSASIEVLPVVYRRHNIEWMPDRGGFVADHGDDETPVKHARKDEKNNLIMPNGNLIVPTATWYVIDLITGLQGIIAMSRTQMNPSKDWMNMATSEKLTAPNGNGRYTPPLFYRGYSLSSRVRDKGENSWFVWNATRGPTILELAQKLNQPDLMAQAIKFSELVTSGEIKVNADTFSDDVNVRESDDDTI